jgi:hypothetical protein
LDNESRLAFLGPPKEALPLAETPNTVHLISVVHNHLNPWP